jgi:hypothetical protein
MICSLIDGVCVKDLKLLRYYNKENKGPIFFEFKNYTYEHLNGLIKTIFLYVHIILEEEVFMVFLLTFKKKRETLDETLITWKKYGGNQCKLIVISKI